MHFRIQQYLNGRGITNEVIEANKISWNGREIVIPIFESYPDKVAFNKYRRDPERSTGPKYRYDFGTSAHLFNERFIKEGAKILIAEGEMDALVLQSLGYNAISSTGGAGTFKEEWAEKLEKAGEIYICYDNDDSGVKGALKLQAMMPKAKIVWLPRNNFSGKDVCDFLQEYDLASWKFLLESAKSYPIPSDPKEDDDIEQQLKEYGKLLEWAKSEKADDQFKYRGDKYWFDEIIAYIQNRITSLKKKVEYIQINANNKPVGNDPLSKARAVPITEYLQGFNKAGYRKCLWHRDKTPSLKIYPEENRLHCYGQCGPKDVIDVVMELYNLSDAKEAVKFLLNK